jgi:alkylation response protein AidB-like acyl-CoA dehydrogenase
MSTTKQAVPDMATTADIPTHPTEPAAAELIERARALAPLIHASRDEIEQERQLPRSLVEAMTEAGLFRMWVPRSLGGAEADVVTHLRTIEEVARADGAAGWNVAIGNNTGILAAYMPDMDTAREIFGDPRTILAGSTNPRGQAVAVPVEGGYRLSGRWGVASGCQHASWLVGVCVVMEGDAPRAGANGAPQPHAMLFPRTDASIIDTWHVGGLRGTGSHDIEVRDLFVPAARAFPLDLSGKPRETGTLYQIPLTALGALPLAAVATGIARAAIDALTELATAKTPYGTQKLLRERSMAQISVARAEGLLGAARAFLFETAAETWATVATRGELPRRQQAMLRLAGTHAVSSATQAVDLMYGAGGGSAIYTSSPLERCFRDIHTLTQHAMIAQTMEEPIGRVLLGMEPGTTLF